MNGSLVCPSKMVKNEKSARSKMRKNIKFQDPLCDDDVTWRGVHCAPRSTMSKYHSLTLTMGGADVGRVIAIIDNYQGCNVWTPSSTHMQAILCWYTLLILDGWCINIRLATWMVKMMIILWQVCVLIMYLDHYTRYSAMLTPSVWI